MKKLLAIFLTTLLMLTACGGEADSPSKSNPFSDSDVTKPASSTIFGRSISYDAFTPAEGLSLPVSSSEISDVVQIEKKLFILANNSVYLLNLETGEQKNLTDTTCTSISKSGDELYLFDSERGAVNILNTDGVITSELTISDFGDGWSVKEFVATEKYYVFLRNKITSNQAITDCQIACFEKTGSGDPLIKSVKNDISHIAEYTENMILACEFSPINTDQNRICTFDCETGELKKLRGFTQLTNVSDMVYNTKANSLIMLGQISDTAALYEASFESEDNEILIKYDLPGSTLLNMFVTIYENIISVIPSSGDSYLYYDYCDPPQCLTIAYCKEGDLLSTDLKTIINYYEKENNVVIKTICYSDSPERLNLKLMAGDTDIDLFATFSLDKYIYIRSQTYCDLSTFPTLVKRLESNPLTSYASSYNGGYVGVPFGIVINSSPSELDLYLMKNVSAINDRYSDENGNELYKLLSDHYKEANGKAVSPTHSGNEASLYTDYLMLNSSSSKKDEAVEFLSYVFDVLNGDKVLKRDTKALADQQTDPELAQWYLSLDDTPVTVFSAYPEAGDTSNLYNQLDYRPISIAEPIFDAYDKAISSDGKDSTLKKMAREAAAEVAMRIGE